VGIVDGVVARYRADADRVYVSGLSMGGKGTWLVAEAAPDRFAAVAPICAVSVKPAYAREALKYVPTWIICGSDDGEFTNGSKEMGEVLKSVGAPSRLTVVPHEGHGVWGRFYSDARFYDWLLTNKRTAAQASKSAAATKPVK
jgi:predicted peptidase